MKNFAAFISALDQTNKTNVKVEALEKYLHAAADEDKLWAIALLTGKRPRRTVNTTQLWTWACELSNIPPWLFEESYHAVGDLSETIALLLPEPVKQDEKSLSYWMSYLKELESLNEQEKKEKIISAWMQMDYYERFVFNKLITGGFRIGVSQQLVIKALSNYTGIDAQKIAHRLMGNWHPWQVSFRELIFSENIVDDLSRPYPFFLAYPLEGDGSKLGEPQEWQAEWKWDGIRGQLIKREGEVYLWSRGEDLITDKFPEFGALKNILPDGTVLDGELLPFKDNRVMSFALLSTRIGRKNLTPKILKEVPVILYCYDLLEINGKDIRAYPLRERRKLLMEVLQNNDVRELLKPAPVIEFKTWEELTEIRKKSRENFSEGLMLKKLDSPYETGRRKGSWWKWKIDPLSIDAVLIYAQPGSGRRANLFTDYTFAVWKGDELVPFAKAYSGLKDEEIAKVDAFVRKNTIEKFGPVRSVKPELVFEIGFEGIQKSSRHKSGVALRFPRILKWRIDKPAKEADTLENLNKILEEFG